MTKYIKYKFLALLIVLVSTSCNKWLDLKPQDGIVRESFWETKEQLNSSVIGIYTSLLNQTLVTNLFIWGELRADMVAPTIFTKQEEFDFNNDEILSTNALTNWSTIYTTINYCNTVIQYAPSVLQKDATLTQVKLDNYLAEARGIRGLMYFYLLRIWGEVPLQLKASSSDSQIEQLPKSSKDAIYQQIKADLDFAALYAVNSYGADNASNKGRITQYAIYAMQADVALWMDKYDECIAACNKVVSSNRFGLLAGTNASLWYSQLYITGNSNESIFEIQFDNQALNPWFTVLAQTGRRFTATTIMDQVFGTDADPLRVDIRAAGSYRAADFVIWKLTGTTNVNNTITATSATQHWIFYRYADILLMKAEALAWTGKGQEALDILNDVRTRAQALPITAETPDVNSAGAVSDYILHERQREFAFEGKRWFDLLRHAKRNNYAKLSLITDALIKTAAVDKQQAILNKMKDVRSHYLPIIITELQADKLLVQNPFYK